MIKIIKYLFDWMSGKPKTKIKKIVFGTLPNATTKSVAHGLTSDQYARIIRFWGQTSGATTMPIPYVDVGSLANGIRLALNDTNIVIITASNYSAYTATIYIEYEV